MLCICARVVSTICSGQPSARAAAASFSMTCSLFFSLLLAVSMRQVDIASKAAFTALRASSESAGAHVGLKSRGVTSAYLFCMAVSPVTDCKNPLGEPRRTKASQRSAEGITVAPLSHDDVMQTSGDFCPHGQLYRQVPGIAPALKAMTITMS